METYPTFATGPVFEETFFSLARTQLIFFREAHVESLYSGQHRDP